MMQRPDWFDEDLFPFESHTVEIDGSVVHYVDEGEGVPLLMLHGNPTWSFLYRKLISGLSGTFRCIALDYPGFGLSTAPAGYTHTAAEHSAVVEGFVDQLGLDGQCDDIHHGGDRHHSDSRKRDGGQQRHSGCPGLW